MGSTSRFVFIVRIGNGRDKYKMIIETIESYFEVMEKYLSNHPKAVVMIFRQRRRLEPASELVSKADRYDALAGDYAIIFVLENAERLKTVREAVRNPRVRFVLMEEFTSLADPVFTTASGERSAFF